MADNGSDRRVGRASRQAHGATVIPVPQRGFGAACHAGLLAATSEIVCFMDADASLDPHDLPQVADPVLAGEADLVLGRGRPAGLRRLAAARPAGEQGPRRRSCAAAPESGCATSARCARARRTDCSGWGSADRRFGYPLEMVMAAATTGWRIHEVDIPYLPRSGRSKVTGTVSGTVRTVRDMRRVLAS